MIPKLVLLGTILATPGLTQFGGIQPDVRFDAGNDRFDLTDMISDTNAMYQKLEAVRFEDNEEENRRSFKRNDGNSDLLSILTKGPSKGTSLSEARRSLNVIEDELEYQQNLKDFLNLVSLRSSGYRKRMKDYVNHLHGGHGQNRRTNDANEKEILMHHAVPFYMNIDGFMKVPLNISHL